MTVDSLNLKPAAEAPPPRPAANLAEPRRPAVARPSPNSSRVESTVGSGPNSSSRSRLTYDDELSRVFVEIVDPGSGEVLSRFPPEQLIRHIDSLIEQELVPESQKNTGFLVDRSV